jgi:transcription elongation factor GreA
MTENVTYLTKDGLSKLKDELDNLVHHRRKEIAARIQEAKELGDLSENAEYQEAKNEQAFNEGRIEELEGILRNVIVIDEKNGANGLVQVGSSVTCKYNGDQVTFHIVGSNEAEPLSGHISNESPIGQALIGKQVGEAVTITTPKGQVVYQIDKIA